MRLLWMPNLTHNLSMYGRELLLTLTLMSFFHSTGKNTSFFQLNFSQDITSIGVCSLSRQMKTWRTITTHVQMYCCLMMITKSVFKYFAFCFSVGCRKQSPKTPAAKFLVESALPAYLHLFTYSTGHLYQQNLPGCWISAKVL